MRACSVGTTVTCWSLCRFWEETLSRGGSSPNLLALARAESNTPPEVC